MLQLTLWLIGLAVLAGVAVRAIVVADKRSGIPPSMRSKRHSDSPRAFHRRGSGDEIIAHDTVVPSQRALPDLRNLIASRAYQTTRRRFLNRTLTAFAATIGIQFGTSMFAFFWPKRRRGSFGNKVDLGDASALLAQTRTPAGAVTPVVIPAAQAYVVPVGEDISGSQFESSGVVEGGLMVLWHRCVHLGCRVPYCAASQGFECPCHGSKYNLYGEYEDGPAPRNLDRFIVSIDDNNRLIADTGQVLETPRARNKTVQYPQGPSCI